VTTVPAMMMVVTTRTMTAVMIIFSGLDKYRPWCARHAGVTAVGVPAPLHSEIVVSRCAV
jgi:hypothetical protein